MNRGKIVSVMILSVLLLLAGCDSKDGDRYVFATDPTSPPFEFYENGKITGYEIELLELIGEKTDTEFEVREVLWDNIFSGVINREYDGAVSNITITDAREKNLAFSEPTATQGQNIIVAADSRIDSVYELEGKAVGVIPRTTGQYALMELGIDLDMIEFESRQDAIREMLAGRIDAVICDSVIAGYYTMKFPEFKGRLKIAGEPFTAEYIAFAVQKNNKKLIRILNDGLEKAEQDGSLKKLKNKWGIL